MGDVGQRLHMGLEIDCRRIGLGKWALEKLIEICGHMVIILEIILAAFVRILAWYGVPF